MTTLQTTARNASLGRLRDLLDDQHARKIDMIIPSDAVRSVDGDLVVKGADPVIEDDGVTDPNGRYTPTAVCDEHLAEKLGIPVPYMRRLRSDRPDLFDANVNGWLHGAKRGTGAALLGLSPLDIPADDRSFMLRTFRGDDGPGVARAFLSSSYRIVDNFDVLTAALEGVRDAGVPVEIDGCDLSDRRMYVRVKSEAVSALAPDLLRGYRSPFSGESGVDNPTVFAGFVISNSEVGAGAFTITPRLVVQVCSNGMTITRDALRSVHLGSKLDDGVIRYSDETQRKNLELVTAQTRDAVSTFLDVAYMRKVLDGLAEKARTPLADSARTIEIVGKHLRFGAERTSAILDLFIRGGDTTAGGVMHAVTALAQRIDDADVAAELEAAALPALDLAAVNA